MGRRVGARVRRALRRSYAAGLQTALIAVLFAQSRANSLFDVFPDLAHWVGSVGSDVFNFVREQVDNVKDWIWEHFLKPAWDTIGDVINMAVSLTNAIWDWIKPIVAQLWQGITNAIGTAWQMVTTWAGSFWNQIVGFVHSLVDVISQGLQDVWGFARGLTDTIYHGLIEPIWQGIVTATTALWNNLVSPALEELRGFFRNIWSWIQPFIEPILGDVRHLWGFVQDIWSIVMVLRDKLWPILTDPLGWITRHLQDAIDRNSAGIVDRIVAVITDNADHAEDILLRWLG